MRPRIVAQLSESIPSGTFTTRRVERRRGNTSTRRVERRRWAGREGVSATQDLRLRVRAPLKLSTSGRFVPANFPFSASSASSCSFSSLSSRCSQSCRNSADQQETANDIKQERPRMPVHVPSVVGSLTDPLACASSLYALARPPYKHAARASGSSVLSASLPVLNGPTRLRFELVRAGASPIQARSASKWNPAFWSLLRRGEAAYGVRELVTAFWSTAARKHPSSRVPISQLRSAISDTLRPRRS